MYFTQLFGAIATLRLVKHLLKRIPLLKLNSDNGAASLDPDSIWGDDGGLSATGIVNKSMKITLRQFFEKCLFEHRNPSHYFEKD